MAYLQRSIESTLGRAASQFPVVTLTGPRQSGKTTLLRRYFGVTHRYVSLEAPDVRSVAIGDPVSFMRLHEPPVIFDEIQYAPDLMSYIKERVDDRRDAAGQYVLTGSQNLLLLERVTQSLAGRVCILRLLPLSQAEAAGAPDRAPFWERQTGWAPTPNAVSIWDRIVRGGFPELAHDPARDAHVWHSNYVQTYLERDVRSLRQIGDLTQFQGFLTAMAVRSGSLLNVSEVARDVGVAVNTVKAWLSVLEASYQIAIVRPYFRSAGKRMVKAPKIFFTDTGTLCYLAGIRDGQEACRSNLSGALFETAVFGELLKGAIHRGEQPRMYFWRTAAGAEVDFVIGRGTSLVPIKAKASSTASLQRGRGIAEFRKTYPDAAAPGFVVYPGEQAMPMGGGAITVPFDAL